MKEKVKSIKLKTIHRINKVNSANQWTKSIQPIDNQSMKEKQQKYSQSTKKARKEAR